MNAEEEARKLRDELRILASSTDPALRKYELSTPPVPPGFYWKIRWVVGCFLRFLESIRLKSAEPWPAKLRGVANEGSGRAKSVLIWAVGFEPSFVRSACSRFDRVLQSVNDLAPVLVTDVAEFAYFSRLKWLVEYIPELDGAGDSIQRRKLRLVARLYRDSFALRIDGLPQDAESLMKLCKAIRVHNTSRNRR